ncbi:MAG: M20/M25/M40 family metallo-hydrolase [Armatimonadota bacterium]
MPLLPDSISLLSSLVALPGPPGQEAAVRDFVAQQLSVLGCRHETDAKGNLRTGLPGYPLPQKPRIVVTAHLDEIALLVSAVLADGSLLVQPLGGAFPWKWGEGPVAILARGESLMPGVLSFGSIHTLSPASAIQQSREGHALTWEMATVKTGLSEADLIEKGVRPGSRVVIAPSRRTLTEIGNGELICSYFLDDRADVVSWLLALEMLSGENLTNGGDILFVASASEEVGGEGALFLMQDIRPDICVALEIGPSTPDAPVTISATPTVWVTDSYSTMSPTDLDLLEKAAESSGIGPLQWQAMTRGGSDASCAASHGLCARPVTLAFPAENSHGFEIMHRDAPETLARLLVAYLRAVSE